MIEATAIIACMEADGYSEEQIKEVLKLYGYEVK